MEVPESTSVILIGILVMATRELIDAFLID
jgi:hypothetical protein